MKKVLYILTVGALLWPCTLRAQDLNQRVVVTNEYEGKVLEAHREAVAMDVPDSLTSFDWNFDYSVFDSPYAGAYEFKPYLMETIPAVTPFRASRLYVRAGAGYTLRPELAVAWNPFVGRALDLCIGDQFKGYVGPYRGFGGRFSGYDLANRLGADFRYEGQRNEVGVKAGYSLVAASDTVQRRFLDAFDMSFALKSATGSDMDFDYALNVDFRQSSDRSDSPLAETWFAIGGQAEYELRSDLAMGGALNVATLSGFAGQNPFQLVFAPYVILRTLSSEFHIGAKLSALNTLPKGGFLFPDITSRTELVPDAIYLNGEITGGNRFVSVYEQALMSHFVWGAAPLSESERLHLGLSFDGTLFGGLQYKLDAGYRMYYSGILEGISALNLGRELLLCQRYNLLRAGAELTWKSERFEAGAQAAWQQCSQVNAIAPAAFTGDFYARYKWAKRFCAGASLHSVSARKGVYDGTVTGFTLPGYNDLGLDFEYLLTGRHTLWARAGNLLCDDVRPTPLHVRPGLNFSVGFCLNFR